MERASRLRIIAAVAVVFGCALVLLVAPQHSSSLESGYHSWLRSLGDASDAANYVGPDPSAAKLPQTAGPYMKVDDSDNFLQPADYLSKLRENEVKEEKKLLAIERILQKHKRVPAKIDIDVNRKAQRGPPGPKGGRGDVGDAGGRGVQGPPGLDGVQGPPGPPGLQGPPGGVGEEGDDGVRGPRGRRGPQGVAGEAGPEGDDGRVGDMGPRGAPGKNGAAGPLGLQGPPGPMGKNGPPGPPGLNGKDGVPIRAAFNGKIGIYWGTQVDTSREGPNVEAGARRVSGVTSTFHFTDIAPTSWQSVARDAGCIMIPELERGPLSLTDDAERALKDAVNAGTILLVMGSPNAPPFINSVFGTSLEYRFASCDATRQPAAAGTRFSFGPATLPYRNAVFGVSTDSLGPNSRTTSMYSCSGVTSVFRLSFGRGFVIYMGYDWFLDSTDADWVSTLEAALKFAA